MGLFGDSEEEKEEVQLGIPDEEDKKESEGSTANVGEVDFSESEPSGSESSSTLRNEVSSMDSVEKDLGVDHPGSENSSDSPSLGEIRDQNQEIINKLDKVLSRL